MQDKNINPPALAKELVTDRTNITRYLRGERTPKFSNFVALIEFFNCSADYLLGISEFQHDDAVYVSVKPFAPSLREALSQNGKSQYGLAKQQKISLSLIHAWLNGSALPSMENLVKICKYTEMSADYLLGRVK